MAVIPIPRSTPHGAKPKNPHAANLNFPRVTPPAAAEREHEAEPDARQANLAAEERAPSPEDSSNAMQALSDAPQARPVPAAQSTARRSLPVITRSAEFRDAFPQQTWLLDGAMATVLFSKGVSRATPVDELNLTLPAVVRDVHREYLAAGAQIVSTNTFGANRIRLTAAGAASNMVAINRAAVRIARQASVDAGSGAFIAGVIGPLGLALEPMGTLSIADAQQAFRDQAAALHGVDLFVLETFRDLQELQVAGAAIRSAAGADIVVIAQVSVEADGTLGDGIAPEVWMPELDRLATDLGIDAIGVNCSTGPHATVEAIRHLAKFTSKPLAASPSAGLPMQIEGRPQYPSSVEYFAAQTRKLLEAGASVVGGCCGTTPDYLRQMRNVVETFRDAAQRPHVQTAPKMTSPGAAPQPVALKEKSKLGAKLAAGKFVTIVELDAPRSHELAAFIGEAKQCKKASIDAIAIEPGSRTNGRMSAQVALHLAQVAAGIETVLYISARGQSARGVQTALGEANALGLHNVLCLTGNGPGAGRGLDSIRIVRLASGLNGGADGGGNRFDLPSALALGAGVNLASLDPSDDPTERNRFEAKIAAGAEFAIAQPVFDRELLETCLRQAEQFNIPVIASVLPLTSVSHADYVRNELLIPVPEALVRRLSEAGEAAVEVGVEIAREQVAYLREIAAGVRVIAAGIDTASTLRIAKG